jgi:hypothetical protein
MKGQEILKTGWGSPPERSREKGVLPMSPWLKAGLIGAAVVTGLNLLGLIPCVGLFTCLLGLLAYVGVGALAAYWMPPLRMAGPAAGQGALAAALAALIGGIVNAVIMTIQMAITDTASILSQIPAETMQQLEQAGIDPSMFVGPGAGVMIGSVCCLGGLIFAAILGAVGGAVFAAIKSD